MINQVTLAKPLSTRFGWVLGTSLSLLVTRVAAANLATKLALTWFAVMSFVVIYPFKGLVKLSARNALMKPAAVVRLHGLRATRPMLPALLKVSEVATPVFSNKLTLHSFSKQYNLVFSGKVTCGDNPCREAAVKLHVESRQNPEIVKTGVTHADGTYEMSIFLKESPHEHMDWWIVADSPESAAKQVSGREILMDDANVQIEEPIQLL